MRVFSRIWAFLTILLMLLGATSAAAQTDGTPIASSPEAQKSIQAAGEISGVFSNFSLILGSGEDGVLGYWEAVQVNGSWCLPDLTPAGSTFTLVLPPELTYMGPYKFNLFETGTTNVVASAVVNGDGNVVSFTTTDYPASRVGVCGSISFWSSTNKGLIDWGSDETFTFTGSVDGDINITVPTDVVPDEHEPQTATKAGWWRTQDQEQTDNVLTYRIQSSTAESTSTVTIDDNVPDGAGWVVVCSEVRAYKGSQFDSNGDLDRSTWQRVFGISCTETSVSLTVELLGPGEGSTTGEFVELYIRGTITDTELGSYLNTATLSFNDQETDLGAEVVRSNAGGDGSGTIPTPPPTVPITPTPGTVVPPTEVPGVTPTPSPTTSPSPTPTSPVTPTTGPGTPTPTPETPVPGTSTPTEVPPTTTEIPPTETEVVPVEKPTLPVASPEIEELPAAGANVGQSDGPIMLLMGAIAMVMASVFIALRLRSRS